MSAGSSHDTREARPDIEAPLIVWEYAFSLKRQVDALVGELDTLRAALRDCQGAAGHPDAAEGCRLVIRLAAAALAAGSRVEDA